MLEDHFEKSSINRFAVHAAPATTLVRESVVRTLSQVGDNEGVSMIVSSQYG